MNNTTTGRFYFDNKPEGRTSYRNQQLLAARDLGTNVVCIHGSPLGDFNGCPLCRCSGTPLVPVAESPRPSFLNGRRTFTTDPNRTDAVQVAMFDAANVDEPALFDGLFA